jgi:CxxC-x17-CxxC domain-containing protein
MTVPDKKYHAPDFIHKKIRTYIEIIIFISERRRFQQWTKEMHKATCADCGKETEVPFKPSGDRPVYCQECYQKHKPKRY